MQENQVGLDYLMKAAANTSNSPSPKNDEKDNRNQTK